MEKLAVTFWKEVLSGRAGLSVLKEADSNLQIPYEYLGAVIRPTREIGHAAPPKRHVLRKSKYKACGFLPRDLPSILERQH